MSALDRKLLRDLGLLRGQAATIALVVAAGVASDVALRSAWASLQSSRDRFYEELRFGDVFVQLERAPENVRRRIEEIQGVALAYARVVEHVRVPVPGITQPPIGRIVSIPSSGEPPLNGLRLEQGRLPRTGASDEAVLLAKFARSHDLVPEQTVPIVVRGVRRELRVVGIASSPEFVYAVPQGEVAPDDERFAVFWMHRDAAAALLGMEGAFNDAVLRLEPGASEPAVLAEVDRLLEPWGGLGAVGRARQASNEVLEGEMEQLRGLVTVVPLLFLGVAAFLLNVVLSRLVLLQRAQIAVLKAVGYPERRIGAHYLKLVSVVVLAGAALGVGLGAYLGSRLTALYADVFGFPRHDYGVGLEVVGVSLLVSAGAAALGASIAVRQVMRLPPAEAMRPPPPAIYRRTVLERAGFDRLLGPGAKLILREIERHPVRAAFSMLGLALAVGILVAGRFYVDAVELILDLQFQRASREDLAVTFDTPRPDRAVRALELLPGVTRAEGLRTVPVRWRAGHVHRDGILTGYPPDADLRRPVGLSGRPVALPAEGAILTETLANLLGVRPGDTVEIEVREGDRRRHPLRVAGLVDELFGLQGHMTLPALLAVLGEQQGVSTALLSVNPESEAEVERRLADMPEVASVTSRPAATRRFREQMGKTVIVMTLIVTLFAATIAIGVVYNDARIALSLRSRDLASLRVLGFTRREISAILLGELAVIGLAALPVGLALGRFLAALIASTTHPERIRLPVVVSDQTYGFAAAVAIGAGIVSALLVRRQLDHLDLIGVLKTRE